MDLQIGRETSIKLDDKSYAGNYGTPPPEE
jgi:hypothetical protein